MPIQLESKVARVCILSTKQSCSESFSICFGYVWSKRQSADFFSRILIERKKSFSDDIPRAPRKINLLRIEHPHISTEQNCLTPHDIYRLNSFCVPVRQLDANFLAESQHNSWLDSFSSLIKLNVFITTLNSLVWPLQCKSIWLWQKFLLSCPLTHLFCCIVGVEGGFWAWFACACRSYSAHTDRISSSLCFSSICTTSSLLRFICAWKKSQS